MTVAQLIAELQKYPKDLPVAIFKSIQLDTKNDPDKICVSKQTHIQSFYPDFEYVNLE